MNGTSLIDLRCVTADDLARIAGRGRTTVYRNLTTEPPPLWLLQAFADWYQQNKPLQPMAIDEAYRQILFDLWPKPPVDPSPNKPSRKRRTKEANDAEHVRDESAADPAIPLHASSRAPSRPRSNAAHSAPRQPDLQDAPVEKAAPADLPVRLPDIGRLDFTRVDLEGWTRAFYEAPEGAVQITRRAIISRIQQCPAYPLKKTEFAIKQKLSQTWRKLLRGRPARARRIDPELHDNRAWVCELLAGWIFAEERREPHAKGAYSKRAWMDDLPKLRAAYDCFHDQIVARLGREPSVHTIATWCRDFYGKSDKVERAKEHYQETIGFRARFSGEVWFLDATGLPFQVDGVQAAANRQGKVAQWAHLRTDLASGQTHTWWNPGKSETDGWSDALVNFLARAGYAPAWAICDRISHLFSDLCRIEAGKTDELTMGVVAMLACGVKPYVHAAERPTAGASVERAVRTYKNSVVEQLFRMRIAKALQGRDQKAWRRFEDEEGFREFLKQSESHMNASMLHRGDNKRTREQLFSDHDESVAWRSGRALAPNFQTHLFAEILPRRRAVRVAGGEIDYRRDGRRISARLNGELPLSAREGVALAIPGGALARDEDPDLMRVVVVQVGQGLPKFHQIEAYADRRDFFGEIERKPFVGEHPVAVPATERDAEALRRQAAANSVRQIAALRTDQQRQAKEAFESEYGEVGLPPGLSETGS